MPQIEIKSRWDGKVLHIVETDSLREAILFLVKQGADLSGANLSWSNLSGANLSGANLSWSDLSGANLSWSDLSGTDLSGSNLSGANLSWSNLSWSNLSGANLSGANLSGANLSGANLSGANLSGTDLSGTDLSGIKIGDLICLSELSDAISIAPLIWDEWDKNSIESAQGRFGLYRVGGEDKALIAMWPRLNGGFCFVLNRREIWAWSWSCPDPGTVPVLWRESDHERQ